MKCKCLGRYATWVCRAVLAGSLLMAPMVTQNFVSASNASTSVTTADEADAILKEAKAIVAQPGTFYTLYVGMPHSDFRANFSNLPGWKVSHYDDYKGSLAKKNITRWKYERVLPVKNSFIKQELYIGQLYDGPVYYMGVTFVTSDKVTASKIYKEMYMVLKNRYSKFEKIFPYGMDKNRGESSYIEIEPKVLLNLSYYKDFKKPTLYNISYGITGEIAYNLY